MTRRTRLALAVALAPAVLTAPRPENHDHATTVDEVVARCRADGLEGWELVDRATRLVHDGFDHHSLWHLWESPSMALAHGRGWSAQYNGALATVLRRLGFQVTVVHAARVRGLGRNPWWQAGHTWLRVVHAGRTLDVCAARADHRAGRVSFVAMTPVRPVHGWTAPLVSAAVAPVVATQAWRQLAGSPRARWLYRPFDEQL